MRCRVFCMKLSSCSFNLRKTSSDRFPSRRRQRPSREDPGALGFCQVNGPGEAPVPREMKPGKWPWPVSGDTFGWSKKSAPNGRWFLRAVKGGVIYPAWCRIKSTHSVSGHQCHNYAEECENKGKHWMSLTTRLSLSGCGGHSQS